MQKLTSEAEIADAVVQKNQPERKRIYLGGLSASISEQDLRGRFGPLMDSVHSVDMVPRKRQAYLEVDCTESQLKKCMKLLSGTNWKGGSLKMEVAKPSILNQLAQERQAAQSPSEPVDDDEGKKNKKKERNRKPYQYAEDMSVISPKNCKKRRSWKRLPSGKLVRLMRVRMPGSQQVTVVDPGKTPEQFKNFRYPNNAADVGQSSGFNISKSSSKEKPDFLLPQKCNVQEVEDIADEHEGDNFIPAEKEKSTALSILSQIFGEPMDVDSVKKPSIVPKVEPSEPESDVDVSEEEIMKEEEEEEITKEMEVTFEKENKKMKSLFFGETEVKPSTSGFGFSFLPPAPEEVAKKEESTIIKKDILSKTDVFVEESRKSEQTPFFFCYAGNSRSIFDPSQTYVPKHIVTTKEQSTKFWNGVKEELTHHYKSSFKNAQRLIRK